MFDYRIINKGISIIISLLITGIVGCSQELGHEFQGYIKGEYLYIASPFSGTIKRLLVQRGDKVKTHSLLAVLDPEPEQSQYEQAKATLQQANLTLADFIKGQRPTIIKSIIAQIDQAKAALNLAKIQYERNRQLFAKQAVDKSTLDTSLADLKVKEASLQQLEANLAEAKLGKRIDETSAQAAAVKNAASALIRAQWSLQQKTLFAPTDAFVYDTFFKKGEFVPATNPVLALLAPQYIRIVFFIPETWLARIKVGGKVEISCDGCAKKYTAIINYVSPQAEYEPPLVYSRETNYKYVFRIEATPKLQEAYDFHPGQPVYVRSL